MLCMKCGVEIPEDQVFCGNCLERMAQYPVKPGTPVHLPKQVSAPDSGRKPGKKKRTLSPEEQISNLRLRVLRLRLAVAVLAFFFCVVCGFFALNLYQQYTTRNPGQNYTIDTTMNS